MALTSEQRRQRHAAREAAYRRDHAKRYARERKARHAAWLLRPGNRELQRQRDLRIRWRLRGVVGAIPTKPEVCDACREARRLQLDHDHVTGRIRGWLCGCCNRAIGLTKDSPSTLIALAHYLVRS